MKFIFLVFALAGCARPNYYNAPEVHKAGEEKLGATATCDKKFEQSNLCLSWHWEKRPKGNMPGQLILRIWRPNKYDGSPVLVDVPQIGGFSFMPEHSHPGGRAYFNPLDVGTFQVTGIVFSMAGKYQLKVLLKDAAGNVVDSAIIDF